MVKRARKVVQKGEGFIDDAYTWVKDNHILSGIGSAVTPMIASWNPIAVQLAQQLRLRFDKMGGVTTNTTIRPTNLDRSCRGRTAL